MKRLLGTLLLLVTAVLCEDSRKAICKMFHFESSSYIGVVNFIQNGTTGPVHLTGNITKLTLGKHGIHVHQYGNISNNCAAAGAHFNPENKTHGGPTDAIRHVGDLGNLDYMADPFFLSIEDNVISLYPGERDINGRSLAIHSNEDDLGKGHAPDSNTTGNSGPRIACCVIENSSSASKFTFNLLNLVILVSVLATRFL